jgi:hypothetical protein
MLSLTFILLGSVPCEPLPCVCIRTTDPRPTIQMSAAVFLGRVIGVTGTRGYTGSESPDGLPWFMDSVTVVVEQTWKGNPPDTVHAAIELTGPDCPTRFAPNDRYLVYAGLRDGAYIIEMCTRTSRLDSKVAQGDVQVLERPDRKRH